jgi:hypothetical protein
LLRDDRRDDNVEGDDGELRDADDADADDEADKGGADDGELRDADDADDDEADDGGADDRELRDADNAEGGKADEGGADDEPVVAGVFTRVDALDFFLARVEMGYRMTVVCLGSARAALCFVIRCLLQVPGVLYNFPHRTGQI